MMGSSQHGHMASVGYDLYCRMLEDTIMKFKGEIDKEPIETTVELKVDAFIPEEYIKDETQKIEVYKKIAAINSYEDFIDVQEELEDRFSDIPPSVQNLMDIAYIRSVAKKIGIEEVKEKGNEVLVQFESNDRLNEAIRTGVKSKYNRIVAFRFSDKPILAYNLNNIKKEDLLDKLKEFILFMKDVCKN